MNQINRFSLLVLGILIVVASLWFLNPGDKLSWNSKSKTMAWVEVDTSSVSNQEDRRGEVFIIRQNQRMRLRSRANLISLDTIESTDDAEPIVTLDNGARVRILQNSSITLEILNEAEGPRIYFVIKSGDLKVEHMTDGSQSVFVAKNGQRVPIDQFEGSNLEREPAFVDPSSIKNKVGQKSNSPSEKEISDIFQKNKSAFFKCYGQLLQKKPKAKGEVSLAFMISDTGKTNQIRSTSAKVMRDQEFNKCLTEVVGRMSFKPFQGSPISTIFPLKFE